MEAREQRAGIGSLLPPSEFPDQTQVGRLGCRHLYPLSYFTFFLFLLKEMCINVLPTCMYTMNLLGFPGNGWLLAAVMC